MSQQSDVSTEPADDDVRDREELSARVAMLEAENRRLRQEYVRARRARYRRTALGLAGIGLVALVAGVLFPATRQILLTLGAIGVFAAVLTYYLTPERFVSASVGERVYEALAANEADVVADLGLAEDRVYVPTDATEGVVRLFVPQEADWTLPDPDVLDRPFVVDGGTARGLSLRPTGAALFEDLERALAGPLAEAREPLAEQLADGLVEQFELADAASVDAGPERVSVGIDGSVYGAVDRFDHPVASLLGVGIAVGLDEPVAVSVTTGDDRFEHVVTVRATE